MQMTEAERRKRLIKWLEDIYRESSSPRLAPGLCSVRE